MCLLLVVIVIQCTVVPLRTMRSRHVWIKVQWTNFYPATHHPHDTDTLQVNHNSKLLIKMLLKLKVPLLVESYT